ncbi:MAG: hypothetical protein IJZ80_01225 [Clostridia bacterium]|nr:hypothetical protein [Clostridia bacterium]
MKTKKIVALLLSLLVMLTSLSLLCIGASAVVAQTSIDIPNGDTYTLNGVDYTVIRTVEEMNAAATANAEGGKNYILAADLDYTGKEFVRIHLANGIFNGNGHSITGVNINMTATDGGNNLSMFKFTNDATVTVSNLTVGAPENPVTVTGSAATATNGGCRVGTLFGYLQSTATFENVTVYSNVSADGTFRVGGFIGEARAKITMKNCVFNGNVTVTNSNNNCPAGGLIGHCYNMSAANIENCASYGTVSSTVFAGGLIGGFTNTITMTNCANYAAVSAEKSAGLIADAGEKVSGKVTMTGCFNVGAVTGTTSAAGLIGTVSKHSNEAYNDTTLTNCANIGTVTGTAANDLIATTYPDSKVTVTNCGAFGTAGAFKTYEIVKAKGGEATTTTTDKTAAEALTFMTINCSYAIFGIEDNKIVIKTVADAPENPTEETTEETTEPSTEKDTETTAPDTPKDTADGETTVAEETTTADNGTADDKKGCKSTAGIGVVALLMTLGGAGVLFTKKKEN